MPAATAGPRRPTCLQCGGRMRAATRMADALSGIVLPLLTLAAGVLVTFFVPGVGCVAGPLLCAVALFVGGKRRKIWLCDRCGGFFDRV